MLWPLISIAVLAIVTGLFIVADDRARGMWVWTALVLSSSIVSFWLCFTYALSRGSH